MIRARIIKLLAAVSLVAGVAVLGAGSAAHAESYVPVSGAGSTWSSNAIDQWRKNVNQYGIVVNYAANGSSDGRNQFRNGTVDFGVSEIPYGIKDSGVVDNPPARKYAYMPIVAGGTSFMYNLKIGGKRVTNLRISGETLTKIFTGVVTNWNDPLIKADNPNLALPSRKIVPVVRSDGSGTTAQFTTWMSTLYQPLWDAYCKRAGRDTPCGVTSVYPVVSGSGFVAQSQSLGVSGYVASKDSEGSITYVEYSYALNTGFPVVKLLNKAGYYTEPTASNVAVALLKARINEDKNSPSYLTQILTDVYSNPDPRTYQMSSYSYMIIPTAVEGSFSEAKGKSLGAFAYYFLCQGQQQAPVLGYSPLPINLVSAGLNQVKKIPGVDVENVDIKKCNNPTFSADGTNTLAKTAPQPSECDKKGVSQCTNGTGGAKATSTSSSSGGNGGSSTTGSTTNGGSTTGGTSNGSSGGNGSTSGGSSGDGASSSGNGVQGAGTGATGTDGGILTVGDVNAAPVTLNDSTGWGLSNTMVIFALVLLLGIVVGPPLVTRELARRGR